ncbi:undecaprenyl-diphosphate phosphatase [candidate division WOR-3 bacterium]|nr:undecaprenyl-diphosphate phosphatase [candidate division WOR-3 bacterium]
MKSLILGIVQGLTEFLPISSSGHLVILKYWLNFRSEGAIMEATLHFATLLAIIVFFRRRILDYVTKERILIIIVGTIPIALIGIIFKDEIELMFNNYLLVTVTLSVTGLMLFLSRNPKESKEELDLKMAFIIGLAQALALTPGISRSGFTIATALLLGVSRKKAFEFSFILAIPALLGAFIINIPDILETNIEVPSLLTGSAAAFFSGLLALWIFYKVIIKKNLYLFSYYLWVASGVSLFLFLSSQILRQ